MPRRRPTSVAYVVRPLQERAGVVSGSGPRIAVIGDSYAVGAGLAKRADSWPSYLPGRVRVDAFSGSGFSGAASPCSGVAYADRVSRVLATHPSLVVVEGGLNEYDVPTAQVEAGARRLLRRLDGVPVLLVGPARAPARAAQVDRVDTALARVAAEAGVRYLSAKDWRLSYQSDRLHPTAAGQRVFGTAVAEALG